MDDFPGKRPEEEILTATHRHWMFFVPDTLVFLLLSLLPIGILIALSVTGAEPFAEPVRNFVVVLVSAWGLALVTWYFIRWLDYYLDLAVVTDKRVVDVDQYGLFRRNVSELDYDVIQDVTVKKYGILPTLLNYGNIEIQTAGEQRNFSFNSIPKPEERAKIITDTRDKQSEAEEEATESMKEAAEEMKEVAEVLKEHGEPGSSEPEPDEPPRPEQASQSDEPAPSPQPNEEQPPTQHSETPTPSDQSLVEPTSAAPMQPTSDAPADPDQPPTLPREYEN